MESMASTQKCSGLFSGDKHGRVGLQGQIRTSGTREEESPRSDLGASFRLLTSLQVFEEIGVKRLNENRVLIQRFFVGL